MSAELHTPAGPVRYAVSGPSASGRADLVLIHGWCCERSAMATLREEYGGRHRILEIDLRGHGQSLDAQDDGSMGVGYRRPVAGGTVPEALSRVRIEDYADDVRTLCARSRLHRPVLIGHSMGALAVLAALAEKPQGAHAPTAGILLDPAPVVSEEGKQFWADAVEPLRRDVSGAWRRAFAARLFLPTDRASRVTLTEAMARTRPEVASGAAAAMATFDGEAALRAVDRPLLVVHGNTAERAIGAVAREARVDLTSGQTVGSGHFIHLEVPDQVMPMITRWMRIALPAQDSGDRDSAEASGSSRSR
ncbi:MAG TPA: alpha/beta hydrolase [Ornithinimicrobium sp.]|uniref:alpha/beta fold hydrolase n=1 Tax=Ornithinimicrobium sp. TaxID=1977084 RepID=UPI002B49ADD7|nr:alpha/beta hydrolase [Ornithinimicrobium sp.]HKJ11806.1 alpha/beta hydrolase [Ornithinimicrobium sp.]